MWKLRREVGRIFLHAHALMAFIYEPLRQYFYDRNIKHHVKVTEGKVCHGYLFAIFVIYPTKGVPESVFFTIDHLRSCGYSVFIVSNARLKDEDRRRLIDKVAFLMERPNFGYDFGGYRDAVLFLVRSALQIRQVLFLNDSVWFPLSADSTMLSEMQRSESDYVGTQSFDGGGRNSAFFGSYCFLIKQPLLSSPAFKKYWNSYKLSSNKEIVLRRGERSFSRIMIENSKSSCALYSTKVFESVVNTLHDDELHVALEQLTAFGENNIIKNRLLESSVDSMWRDEVRNLLINQARSKNFIGSSPILSLTKLRFPMIKKNNEMLYRVARVKILQHARLGTLNFIDPLILRELAERTQADVRKLDQLLAGKCKDTL